MSLKNERKVKVELGGYLSSLGDNLSFYVTTPAEALRAALLQVEGLEKALRDADKHGIKFAVLNGKRPVSVEELHLGVKDVVTIMPVEDGSKSGVSQVLVGAVIIAAAFYTGGASLAAGGLTTTAVGGIAVNLGVAMVLGGITQMLAPSPEGPQDSSDVENKPSYAFGGPINTVAQGNPVAIFYGEREVGGAVISAGIYNEDIA